MGQFFYPIILTETGLRAVALFCARDFQEWYKLTEHSREDGIMVKAVVSFGISYGKPLTLCWTGEYATDSNLDYDRLHSIQIPGRKYHRDYARIFAKVKHETETFYHRISYRDPRILPNIRSAEKACIYNLATRQKLSLSKYFAANPADPDMERIHPLPILTCVGNGGNGGDYYGTDMEWVGAWALQPLIIKEEGSADPSGEWEDVSERFFFKEDRLAF